MKKNNIYIAFIDFIGALLCYELAHVLFSHKNYIPWSILFTLGALWILVFYICGFYKIYYRYFGANSLQKIGYTTVIFGALIIASAIFFEKYITPSEAFIGSILFAALSITLRLCVATYFVNYSKISPRFSSVKNILIYGAGKAGAQVASYCNLDSGYALMGYLDDDKKINNMTINGVRIYAPNQLRNLVEKFGVTEVFLAIPSASPVRYSEILKNFSTINVRLRSLPSLKELSSNQVDLSDIKDIDLGDLLLRPPVLPEKGLLEQNIAHKIVLVTGGGGSIGGELCKQIIFLNPKKLVIIDSSEFNLFEITNFLKRSIESHCLRIEIQSILGSVADKGLMAFTFAKHLPDTVFHAAAYKHVGLVEENLSSGISNNINGTLCTAQAAMKYGVQNFVLISTDKAVRPTSAMGASKRVCEMILQAFANSDYINNFPHETCFSMVRFGNVLGSSGSVIPIFQEQIKRGGPLTVRHPEITRYFMSIPEAAQLVMQASSMAFGGEVFLLDMGAPIRISDLAKCMIVRSGLTVKDDKNPDGDIEICYTKMEPGEKLYEEMLINHNPAKTKHPKILMGDEAVVAWPFIFDKLRSLKMAILENNHQGIYMHLKDLVQDYVPKNETELLHIKIQ